jgi:hypothetical protein
MGTAASAAILMPGHWPARCHRRACHRKPKRIERHFWLNGPGRVAGNHQPYGD